MKNKTNSLVKTVAGLGAVAGMRTTIALAVASHYLNKKPKKALAKSKLAFMQSPKASVITKWLSAAELAADKNPNGPNRISLPQLLPRIASGGLVGAVLYQANKKDAVTGFLIGGAAAFTSTYVSFYLRQLLDKIPYVKDPLVGGLEDMVAYKSALSLMRP